MRLVIGTERLTPEDNIALKLDRLRGLDGSIQQAYLAFTEEDVKEIDIESLWNVRKDAELHNKMMDNFFEQKWELVQISIIALGGKEKHHSFCGRLNDFYNSILARIKKYQNNPPPTDWDGIYYQP